MALKNPSILLVCTGKEFERHSQAKNLFCGRLMCPSQIEVLKEVVTKQIDKMDSKKSLEMDGTHSVLKQLNCEIADPVTVVNNLSSALSHKDSEVANASAEIQRPIV